MIDLPSLLRLMPPIGVLVDPIEIAGLHPTTGFDHNSGHDIAPGDPHTTDIAAHRLLAGADLASKFGG